MYVTSNTLFSEIGDLSCILNEWKNSSDLDVKNLGDSIKTKFDKYWGDLDKMNKLIFFANILNPCDKFESMEFSFCATYGDEKGSNFI